jgi:hypothetical protein
MVMMPLVYLKRSVLIDIIGTFNGGTTNFAADVTLRRKATVTGPNTTFNISENGILIQQ